MYRLLEKVFFDFFVCLFIKLSKQKDLFPSNCPPMHGYSSADKTDIKQQMKKSPIKKQSDKSRSPSKSRLSATGTPSKQSQGAAHTTSSIYYCHYKNAIYMGGIKSFKKNGRGILLHDDGASAITSYYNDLLHGHNIFFDSYGLLSAIYNKNKLVECAYRTEGFLVFLNYNPEGELDGRAVLLNHITKSIIYAEFRKGNMIDKSEQNDFSVFNRVFDLGQTDFLIGTTHAKTMKYDFPKIPLIQAQKQGNRIIVGFQKNGFINGLGFSFLYRGAHGGYNPDTHRNEDQFELRLLQRGYYINTQLSGMGEKMFKNGNVYVGEFKDNVFEGHGILRNCEKKNWVSGYFENGNLVELIEYNSQGQDKKFRRIVEALHQRKTNWINNQVHLVNFNQFVDQIEKIIKIVPNRYVKTLQQRKQEVLKKIQEKFISDTNASFDNDFTEESLGQLKKQNNSSASAKKIIHNFNPRENSNSKRKSDSIQSENQGVSFQAPSAFQPAASPAKLKLFEKSNNKASSRAQPQPKFSRSPGNFRLSSSGIKNRTYLNQPSIESRDRYELGASSRQLKKANTSGHLGMPLSSQRDRLDSKRMVGKNKIFKYLQKQQESSPKFIYTKIDS